MNKTLFLVIFIVTLRISAANTTREKRFFFSWLFNRPSYNNGGRNECPTNIICMPLSRICGTQTTCTNGWKCCEDLYRNFCCVNLPQVVTESTTSSTTTSSTTTVNALTTTVTPTTSQSTEPSTTTGPPTIPTGPPTTTTPAGPATTPAATTTAAATAIENGTAPPATPPA